MRMIVVGGGQAGRSLARLLLERRHQVCLIEKNPGRCEELADHLDAAVFPGDGTTVAVLEAAGARDADCVMAVTGVDQDNLVAALYARQQGLRKVIAKCSRENYAAIGRSAGLDSVVAPKLIVVERILRIVRSFQDKSGDVMAALYRIADFGAEAAEFILQENTPNLGQPLKDLHIRKGFLVVALLHQERVVIPSGSTVFSAGDRVIVLSHGKGLQNFRDIFEDKSL